MLTFSKVITAVQSKPALHTVPPPTSTRRAAPRAGPSRPPCWARLATMPRRAVRRRRRARLRVMAAALATAGLTGCTSDSPPEAPAPTETPLSAIDLSGLEIPRTGFCGAVDQDSLAALLGGPPRRTVAYGNGDRVVLA